MLETGSGNNQSPHIVAGRCLKIFEMFCFFTFNDSVVFHVNLCMCVYVHEA